jgi:hypothetical protein
MITNVIGILNVAVAALYAYLTYRIVKASREQAEVVFRPYITITLNRSSDTVITLCVKNTGKTNAQNLRLRIDRDVYHLDSRTEEYNIAKLYAFTNVIGSFPPELELTFPLISSIALQSEKSRSEIKETVFEIEASYSYGRKTVTEKTVVDLRSYIGIWMPEPSIEDRLKEITTEEVKEFKELIKKKLAS